MTSFASAVRVIKSIQRGTVSIAGNTTTTVAINAVDTTKTFISTSCMNGYEVNEFVSSGRTYGNALLTDCVLTNSTTLTCSTGTTLVWNFLSSAAPVLSWEVIEYG